MGGSFRCAIDVRDDWGWKGDVRSRSSVGDGRLAPSDVMTPSARRDGRRGDGRRRCNALPALVVWSRW